MRTDPRLLLRGLGKFIGVVLAAGLVGAGLGVGLAELSGNDAVDDPATPTTAPVSSTAARTQTVLTSTATNPETTTSTAPAPVVEVYRIPRVQVLSADLGAASEPDGARVVSVRVRVTNRGQRPLRITTPMLLSEGDEVALGADARDAAGPLLRPIASGSSATGVLRFTAPAAVAERLATTTAARLRVAKRTVLVKLKAPG